MNILNWKKDFYKRWNVDYQPNIRDEFSSFKVRICNTFVNQRSKVSFRSFNDEYSLQKGIGYRILYTDNELLLSATAFYDELINSEDLYQFLLDLEFGVNLIREKCQDENVSKELMDKTRRVLGFSDIGAEIYISEDYDIMKFYPSGAKLLDDAVVNNVLTWLESYPEAYKQFRIALEKYTEDDDARIIADTLRHSLEQLLKTVLSNNKSMENQLSSLGTFLSENNISTEICNMYIKLIDYYTKYQNKKAKHNDKVNKNEVEFMIYLTGTFMRLLLTVNQ